MVFKDTQEVQSINQTSTATNLDGAYRREDAEMLRNLNRQDEAANLTNLQIYIGDTSPPLSHINPAVKIADGPRTVGGVFSFERPVEQPEARPSGSITVRNLPDGQECGFETGERVVIRSDGLYVYNKDGSLSKGDGSFTSLYSDPPQYKWELPNGAKCHNSRGITTITFANGASVSVEDRQIINVHAGQKKDPTAELDKPVQDPRLDRPVPETKIEVPRGRLQEGCGDREQKGASEEDKRIAATLNKYFDQMDQSHWYTFGKDGELSKSEILEFLASDQGKELSNQEIKDLLAASNQFDRIKGLHYYGLFALDQGSGITQGDVRYLAEGTSSFEQEYGPLLRSLKGMKAPLYTHADLIDHKI